jgi:hypothetical protein
VEDCEECLFYAIVAVYHGMEMRIFFFGILQCGISDPREYVTQKSQSMRFCIESMT